MVSPLSINLIVKALQRKIGITCLIISAFSFHEAGAWPVFAPADAVVLSTFVTKTKGTRVILDVPGPTLSAVVKMKARIAIAYAPLQNDSSVYYLFSPTIDTIRGEVRMYTSLQGYFAVVTDAWHNDFPVQTNWDATLNHGLGGVRVGATDGVRGGTIAYSTDTKQLKANYRHQEPDSRSPYFYVKGLFSNDTTGKQDTARRVPWYDQYVGENYCLVSIPARTAIETGNRILSATGFPVIFRNYSTSFYHLYTNVPVFQILSCVPVDLAGGKRSLCTIILPPYWVPHPDKPYPILFNSTYDLHAAVFPNAVSTCRLMSALVREKSGSAIGVYWNAGGAWASYSLQTSLYSLASYLFDCMRQIFGADPMSIVGIGASRSGFTPLLLAGDPSHSNYRFRLVEATVAHAKPGDNFYDMDVLTYMGMQFSTGYSTGYTNAWRTGWIDSLGKTYASAADLSSFVVAGTTGKNNVNLHGSISDAVVQTLKTKGTKVFMCDVSHDYHKAFYGQMEFVNKAKTAGVALRAEIALRGGHGFCYDQTPIRTQDSITLPALRAICRGEEIAFDTTTHFYRRLATDDPNGGYTPVVPTHRPFVLEAPLIAVPGRKWNFCVTGEPNSEYRIDIYQARKSKSILGKDTTFNLTTTTEQPIHSLAGTLFSSGSVNLVNVTPITLQPTALPMDPVTNTTDTTCYLYRFFYRLPEHEWIEVPNEKTSQPNRYHRAIFYVAGSERDLPENYNFWSAYSPGMLSYGLCEY